MNELSQILYWGNVVCNLGPLLAVTGAATLVVGGVASVITIAEGCFPKKLIFAYPIAFVLLILAAFCPSQETVYAIAASEVGGKVVSSPTGDLATKALNAWLQRQINPTTDNHP